MILNIKNILLRIYHLFKPEQQKPLIGIDIGSSKIKLLAVSEHNGTMCMEYYAEETLPSPCHEHEIARNEQIVSIIRKLVANSNNTYNHACISINKQSSMTKNLRFKTSSELEIMEQIEMEASHYIPYPFEEVYFDFEIQKPTLNSKKFINVVLAAAKIETVEEKVEILNNAGMNVRIVEVDNTAILRALQFIINQTPEEMLHKNIAIFYFRSGEIVLYVFRNSQLHYSEDYIFETNQFFNEAVAFKIDETLQIFLSSENSIELHEIILCGEDKFHPDLPSYVQNKLNIETFLAKPFLNMKVSKSIDQKQLFENSANLVIALGLALRNLNISSINLLPWRESQQRQQTLVFLALIGFTFLMSISIICVMLLILNALIKSTNHDIANIQNNHSHLNNKIQEIKQFQDNKMDLFVRSDIAQKLQNNRSAIVSILNHIPRIIPENMIISSIEKKSDIITILGKSETPSAITTLLKNLQTDQLNSVIKNPKINEIALEKNQKGVGFVLEFNILDSEIIPSNNQIESLEDIE